MKRFIITFFIIALANANLNVLAETISVPSGLSLIVSPVSKVTSKNHENSFAAEIKESITINGTTIFKAGDCATFNISSKKRAKTLGSGGYFIINNGYAYDTNGQRHKVLLSERIDGGDRIWVKGLFCCGIIFWPLLLIGFVHGEQAEIDTNRELEATLIGNFEFEKN